MHPNQNKAQISTITRGIKIIESTVSVVGLGYLNILKIIYIMRQDVFVIVSKAWMSLLYRGFLRLLFFEQTLMVCELS